jgi:hypothetical protein
MAYNWRHLPFGCPTTGWVSWERNPNLTERSIKLPLKPIRYPMKFLIFFPNTRKNITPQFATIALEEDLY